jgi:hypothetical protein
MLIAILVTSKRALADLPPPEWVGKVLSLYPLDEVLHMFTRVLAMIEIAPDPLKASIQILHRIARQETVGGVLAEVSRIQARGGRPVIFSPLHLLNFLKRAILECKGPSGSITRGNYDQLFRAYLAMHDHLAAELFDTSRNRTEQLKEDTIRQSLLGLSEKAMYTIPRYWSLWVSIPTRHRWSAQLEGFLPPSVPRPIVNFILPNLSLWAFWGRQVLENAPPVNFDPGLWKDNPELLVLIQSALREISLTSDVYRAKLDSERSQLGRNEQWAFSFKTPATWPLIQERQNFHCMSMALMANVFCDGLFYRMLSGCKEDQAKVNALTSLFGQIFHEYVYDLWQRLAGPERVRKIINRGQEELGDGIVSLPDASIVYDAKSRRMTLPVARTGNIRAFVDDMKKGILKGASQIDGAIRKLRIEPDTEDAHGLNLRRIYPIVVTATNFPEPAFVYEEIDRELRQMSLLRDEGIAPLLVIDVQSLEILESLKGTSLDALSLLAQKGSDQSVRIKSVDEVVFTELGTIPWNPRLRAAFAALNETTLEWLRTGRFDVETVDRVLHPTLA